MYANWPDLNWNNNLQRQLIALVLAAALVFLMLLIPINIHFDALVQPTSLEVELSHRVVATQVEIDATSEIKSELQIKPNTEVKKTPATQPKVTQPMSIRSLPERQSTPKATITQPTPLPSSTVILKTYRNKQAYKEIGQEFKTPTSQQQDFKFKSIQPSKIYKVTEYINEEIDKPQVQMNFYADGIVGATERFFDKISYKKTFTTRYGTKIYCGGVGPLALCSWK